MEFHTFNLARFSKGESFEWTGYGPQATRTGWYIVRYDWVPELDDSVVPGWFVPECLGTKPSYRKVKTALKQYMNTVQANQCFKYGRVYIEE